MLADAHNVVSVERDRAHRPVGSVSDSAAVPRAQASGQDSKLVPLANGSRDQSPSAWSPADETTAPDTDWFRPTAVGSDGSAGGRLTAVPAALTVAVEAPDDGAGVSGAR